MKLLLVRYGNTCLRLFVIITRFTLFTEISILLIIMLIIGVLHFTSIPFLLVRYGNACLRLFVVLLQDIHCLQRSYHNVDNWGIKLYRHTYFHIWQSFC